MATASKTAKLVITSIVISIIVLAAFTLIFIRFIVPAYQITEDQIYSVLTKLFPVLIGLILIQIGVMAAKKGEPEYKDTIDKLSPNAYDSALYTEPKDDPMLRGKVSPEVFGNASRADAQHAEAVREIIREVPVEVVKEVPVEVIKEVPVETIREVQVPVEIVKEVIFPVKKGIELISIIIEKRTLLICRYKSIAMYMTPIAMLGNPDILHGTLAFRCFFYRYGERQRSVCRGDDTSVSVRLLHIMVIPFYISFSARIQRHKI